MKDIIKVQDILLPKDLEYMKWSVVACDQYTSEPEYWEKLKEYVGDNRSSLYMIFPEAYLGNDDETRIKYINETMYNYIEWDTFKVIRDSFVLVDRYVNDAHRLGLVLPIDLEKYDFNPDSDACIKATEGTVIERIPPRVKIRENAPIELPHVMLLMDDRDCNIIENLYNNRENLEPLYDFDLCMNGGHIAGYKVTNTKEVTDKIYHLLDKDVQIQKYGKPSNILFAVGDGNHSLATAKACWDKIKVNLTEEQKQNHPARYALVEVVNLHQPSIEFKPINRVVTGLDKKAVNVLKFVFSRNKGAKTEMVYDGEVFPLNIPKDPVDATIKIQRYIDRLVEKGEAKVDYVHDRENTLEVAKNKGGVAIFMPSIDKNDLFKYIIDNGVLPRKTFSMGEANSKRYYLEAKLIVPNEEL